MALTECGLVTSPIELFVIVRAIEVVEVRWDGLFHVSWIVNVV